MYLEVNYDKRNSIIPLRRGPTRGIRVMELHDPWDGQWAAAVEGADPSLADLRLHHPARLPGAVGWMTDEWASYRGVP